MKLNKIIKFLSIVSLSFLTSCEYKNNQDTPKKQICMKRVVLAKDKEINTRHSLFDGTRTKTYYVIAFEDGYTDYISFGKWSLINIGDTVLFYKKEDSYFLDSVVCKSKNR